MVRAASNSKVTTSHLNTHMDTHRSLTLCDYWLIWTRNQIKSDRGGRDNVVNGSTLSLTDTHTQQEKMKEQQIEVQISEDFTLPVGQPPFN